MITAIKKQSVKILKFLENKLAPLPVNKKPTLLFRDCGSLYSCRIAVHTGEGAAAIPHLNMWIPILQKTEQDFCIITRTDTAYNLCKEKYQNINLIYAKTPQDLENALNNLNLRIVFYLSNTGNNLHICRFTEYRHIFLGHGDSNKSGSAHNGFKIYDEVWVSGQAHIDRFACAGISMAGTRLRIIGQPQLKYIRKESPSRESFLYLPTWEGTYKEQFYSSLPIATELFCLDTSLTKLAIKMHPMTGSKNKQYLQYADELAPALEAIGIQVQIYPSNIDVLNIMTHHCGFICDNSAVITNTLYFNRPLFIYTPHGVNYSDSNIPYTEFAYTYSNSEEFILCMREFLEKGDTLAEKREKIIDYFIDRRSMQDNLFNKYINDFLY